MSIAEFDAIYIVDLCQPLLDIAKERITRNEWTNVHVLCQDAISFTLPESEWPGGYACAENSLSFVTFSYSLSMVSIKKLLAKCRVCTLFLIFQIPNCYSVIDRVAYLLNSKKGLISVVDFYTSGKTSYRTPHERVLDGVDRECNWFTRWFWHIWFEFHHVILGPQRREYLEHKLNTVSSSDFAHVCASRITSTDY